MQFACPACHQVIEHQGSRPRFCQHCGEPLSGTRTDLAEAATIVGPSADASSGMVPHVTQMLGEYRLVKELGRGGMGVVYEAEHTETGRRLALKVLSPNLPRNSVTVERFLREGRLAAAVSHPCSTFVYGAGETDGQLHIAMELVPGRTLARVVQDDGPLPVNKAVDYILDVIDGLIAAHGVGVIHRDVKPSNCFLGEDGRVKVGDFGLSKSLVTDASLTRTGEFMGTPQYAAPEQVRGGDVDARTDVYAVGATLFYLLSGRGPFVGDVASVIAQIASDAPPSLHSLRAEVPRELDRVVARSLAKDAAARFDDLAQLRQALLPFATAGVSIADVGRRLAAFFLDSLLCGFATAFVGFLYVFVAMLTDEFNLARLSRSLPGMISVAPVLVLVAYFAIAEGRWGCALGKRLLDLRVVNLVGERPGLWRAWLRALVIPGLSSGAAALLPLFFLPDNAFTQAPTTAQQHLQFLSVAMSWLVILGLLSTMRARNGYRGLHELISGTRVVRPLRGRASGGRRTQPVIVPVATEDAPQGLGPFRITGRLGYSGSATVWHAVDTALERNVWIRIGDEYDQAWRRRRISVTRRARPAWLHVGQSSGTHWDAFEAVRGAPLKVLVDRSDRKALAWEEGRLILLDLAEELTAASTDGTLPDTLALEQVWLDENGRVKLLDAPVVPGPVPAVPAAAPAAPLAVAGALELLRQAVDLCTINQALPAHAQRFVEELAAKPADPATLAWAVERLRDLSQRNATLRWDDRLGVLAASSGSELSVYMIAAIAAAGLTDWLLPGPFLQRFGAALLLALTLPAALGFWFRGGPVFRLTGIEVRRRDRPAGRWRCAWRSVAAWGPMAIAWCSLGYVQQLMADPALRTSGLAPLFSLAWSFPLLVHMLGAVISVASPTRGVQDLLAGTHLTPR